MKQEMAKKKEQTLRKTKEQCASLLRRTRRESEEIIKELKAQFNDQGMKKRQETIDAARHKLRGRLDKVSQQMMIQINQVKLSILKPLLLVISYM